MRREDLFGEEARRARGEDVDGDAGDDVVDVEPHDREGMDQATEAPGDDPQQQPDPGPVLPRPEAACPRAEDHHPLDTDVDDADTLGPQRGKAGADRRGREAQGGGDRARGGEVVGVGDHPGDGHDEHDEQPGAQHALAAVEAADAGSRTCRPGLWSGARSWSSVMPAPLPTRGR